jgi:hypothetical protein
MSYCLAINANFRVAPVLPSVDEHYASLWKLAKVLETLGLPLEEWFAPADTIKNSLLNPPFEAAGVTAAALAAATANPEYRADGLRTLGVWNGKEDEGSAVYNVTYATGAFPSTLEMIIEGVTSFAGHDNLVTLCNAIADIWDPMLITVAPAGYGKARIYRDRPGVGWMIYLPYRILQSQVPDAAKVLQLGDSARRHPHATLIVSTEEKFACDNVEHVTRANAIERQLAGQNLLPTMAELIERF